jgi:hypothetical protein
MGGTKDRRRKSAPVGLGPMQGAGRVVRIAIRVLATGLFALVVGICGGLALDAPVTATNDYEPGTIASLLILTISMVGAIYLTLARPKWATLFAVFGAATLMLGAVFFLATDWHARADGPDYECFKRGPAWLFDGFDDAVVQRVPPGVRCEKGTQSFLVRPEAKDWLVLLGESAAGGLALTGLVLFLLGLTERRRSRPRPAVAG